jgi:hypothetical protein
MRKVVIHLILIPLIFSSNSCILANGLIDKQFNTENHIKVISESDCLHISKDLTLLRGNDYQTKWSYSISTYRGKEKKPQVIKTTIIGLNKSLYKKQVVTLIPFRSLSGIKNPESQIALVTVNGKIKKYSLLLPGNSLDKILTSAKKRFGDNDFFSVEVSSTAPMLFINAGIVPPNTSVRVEYEEKVSGGEIIPN